MNLTPMGKLFFGTLVAWIVNGSAMPFKVRGTPEQMKALTDAVFASKRLQEEMKKPDATIESVIEKLNVKNEAAKQFEAVTGYAFPL